MDIGTAIATRRCNRLRNLITMTDWEPKTARAKEWFETLRDQICAAFEAIEREAGSDASFTYTPWQREEEGNDDPGEACRD